MQNLLSKYPIFILVLVSVGLYGFNLVNLQASIMEARNFLVTREMLTENHWFLTTMNNVARYEKPPFPAWFTAPFVAIFGLESIWAYRISTSLFATFGIVYFYKLIHLFTEKEIAFKAALILATSYYFMVIRFEAPSDIYTHVSMIVGLYFLFKNIPHFRWKSIFISSFFIGISILSKGPVSFYALFLPFLIAYFFSFSFDFRHHGVKILGSIILGCILGGTWYVYVRFANPEEFIKIASKETNNWSSYKVKPFYYYWSFFTQSGIWTIPALLSLAYPYFKSKIKDSKKYTFSFLWTIIAVILLSLIPEKKPRYLVPVLIPLAFNTALVLQYFYKNKHLKFAKIFHYVHYLAILLISFAIILLPFYLKKEGESFWLFYIILGSCLVFVVYFIINNLIKKNYSKLFWANIFLTLALTLVGQKGIFLLKKNADFNPISIQKFNNTDLQTYFFEKLEPEIIWEYGQIIEPINENLEINKPFRIIVSEQFLDSFKEKYPQIVEKSTLKTFDRNYFRATDKKQIRFITNVFEY